MESFDVIVIGGGPAGSTAASFLHLMGHRVLVLERERFPRHHIGESMIAASLDVLAEVGLEDKLNAAGFPVKSGGCFIWGESQEPWCIRFDEIAGRPTSFQVKRDVFDKLLLDHSAELGVDVREEHRVSEVIMEDGRVVGVRFQGPDGELKEARARVTIDASGLNAVIANKASRRVPVEELKNMALYGYWTGEHPAPAQLGGDIRPTDRNNIIIKWIGDGWLWFIPLGFEGHIISVGYVTPRSTLPESGGKAALEQWYLDRVNETEEWKYLLSNSTYSSEFHTIKDWSYSSERMAGPGYFAVGDAACFVDPILSSGAYLAILYAKMCAIGVNTCLQQAERETIVQEWYEGLYNDTYTDYLNMARYWYHGSRRVQSWMHEAQETTSAEAETVFAESDRSSFIGLATGNTHAHPAYVLQRDLRSFPFPVNLRKDPRLGYHTEARNALLGHSDRDWFADDPELQHKIDNASAAMKSSRKRNLAGVFALPEPLDRFAENGGETGGRVLSVHGDAQFSLEVIDDAVAMVVTAPDGRRRRLPPGDEALLAALPAEPTAAGVATRLGRSADEVEDFFGEMVAAGVVAAA